MQLPLYPLIRFYFQSTGTSNLKLTLNHTFYYFIQVQSSLVIPCHWRSVRSWSSLLQSANCHSSVPMGGGYNSKIKQQVLTSLKLVFVALISQASKLNT